MRVRWFIARTAKLLPQAGGREPVPCGFATGDQECAKCIKDLWDGRRVILFVGDQSAAWFYDRTNDWVDGILVRLRELGPSRDGDQRAVRDREIVPILEAKPMRTPAPAVE